MYVSGRQDDNSIGLCLPDVRDYTKHRRQGESSPHGFFYSTKQICIRRKS